ncbi:hypothetical protein [Streptomyces sp. KL118A]|uniref:hypothetical protein n=1 Tax=Streptomyces sp. KL118A TaxID=3045153 RepID=UPI00278C7B4B|nr:hypothetical protein [Streptomyces sp. KL118A]
MAMDDLTDGELWPVPPAWLMACDECARLFQRMIDTREAVAEAELTSPAGVDCDPFDSGLSAQLALGQHMAREHVELLPDFEPACPRCATCREDLGRPATSDGSVGWAATAAAEHRARHLIVPPAITERL